MLRNWCFQAVMLEKTLDSSLELPRGWNQSILKEINHEYSLEGLMPRLKLQYFGHLVRRTDSSEKTRLLGKIKVRRRRWSQRMRWLEVTDLSWLYRLNEHEFEKLWEIVQDREAYCTAIYRVAKGQTWHRIEQQQYNNNTSFATCKILVKFFCVNL